MSTWRRSAASLRPSPGRALARHEWRGLQIRMKPPLSVFCLSWCFVPQIVEYVDARDETPELALIENDCYEAFVEGFHQRRQWRFQAHRFQPLRHRAAHRLAELGGIVLHRR